MGGYQPPPPQQSAMAAQLAAAQRAAAQAAADAARYQQQAAAAAQRVRTKGVCPHVLPRNVLSNCCLFCSPKPTARPQLWLLCAASAALMSVLPVQLE